VPTHFKLSKTIKQQEKQIYLILKNEKNIQSTFTINHDNFKQLFQHKKRLLRVTKLFVSFGKGHFFPDDRPF
jgi:hypothetical protein